MKDLNVLIIRILYKVTGKSCIPALINKFTIIILSIKEYYNNFCNSINILIYLLYVNFFLLV